MNYIAAHKKFEFQFPTLDIFGNTSVDIFQWQPKSCLVFDEENGFKSNEPAHNDKAKMFIDMARRKQASLVFTPEYSFPYTYLNEVLRDKQLWPKDGAIWCLSMEGRSLNEYEQFMNSKCTNVYKLQGFIDSKKSYVNALIYLFIAYKKTPKNRTRTLVLATQLKTQSASDKDNSHEGKYMSIGKGTLIFGNVEKGGILFSLICADAFNRENINGVLSEYRGAKSIIFHPQLSGVFHHHAPLDFIGNLNYIQPQTKIISLNWASETTVPNIDLRIKHGFSAIYINGQSEYDCDLIRLNYMQGLYGGYSHHSEIWQNSPEEHVISYSVDSFSNPNASGAVRKMRLPSAVRFFKWHTDIKNEKDVHWLHSKPSCIIDWEWVHTMFNNCLYCVNCMHDESKQYMNEKSFNCTNTNCDKCAFQNIEIFFNTFFQEPVLSEPFTRKKPGIGCAYYRAECIDDSETKKKQNKIKNIVKTISNSNRHLEWFRKIFNENFVWISGDETRNIEQKIAEPGKEKASAWVIYVDDDSEIANIREAINKKYSKQHESIIRNRVLFGYPDRENGMTYRNDVNPFIDNADLFLTHQQINKPEHLFTKVC